MKSRWLCAVIVMTAAFSIIMVLMSIAKLPPSGDNEVALTTSAVASSQPTTAPWRHPKLRADEVLIGNFEPIDVDRVRWKTKRTGTAYDTVEHHPVDGLCAIFVKKSELVAAGINPDDDPFEKEPFDLEAGDKWLNMKPDPNPWPGLRPHLNPWSGGFRPS
jgi:hypothetical protein